MMIEPENEILKRFPLVRSSNAEECAHIMASRFGAAKAYGLASPDFAVDVNFLSLQSIKLSFMRMSTPCFAGYAEHTDFRQRFLLKGNARTVIDGRDASCGAHETMIVSPGQTASYEFSENFSQQVLILDPVAVERKLTALLGGKPNRKLEFFTQSKFAQKHSHRLSALVSFLSQQLDETSSPMPPIYLRELEESILLAFLCVNEHTLSDHLHEDARGDASRTVRRVEEYIEANWDKPIIIENLAQIAGVSARTIFKSFQDTRSYSPRTFVKTIRLRKARSYLENTDPRTSVTGVAFKCSFSNLGHFAKDYRKLFGESPSVTLDRARKLKAAG